MELISYLFPDNRISFLITIILIVFFFAWFILLMWLFWRRHQHKWQINKLGEMEVVTLLKNHLLIHLSQPNGISTQQTTAKTARETFEDIYKEKFGVDKINNSNVVAQHISTIYEAGWDNSQLQVDSLVRNSVNQLFRKNALMRSLLSLFIIGGLLGTLFGLAYSLTQLAPIMQNNLSQPNEVAQGLRGLLSQLKGAFAPSIWGVFFTLIGVVLFSFYVNGCQKIKDSLEFLTLSVWVPYLYPSPFQQQLNHLVQTETIIQKNRENINQIAEKIKAFDKFEEKIHESEKVLSDLSISASQINSFAPAFQQSVKEFSNHITLFRPTLEQVYKTIVDDSKTFHSNVKDTIEKSKTFQEQANKMLTTQNELIKNMLNNLKKYEKAYLEDQPLLREKLSRVLEEAEKAYQGIGERNEEIRNAIQETIGRPLETGLENITTTLDSGLEGISGTLGGELGNVSTTLGNELKSVNTSLNSGLTEMNRELNLIEVPLENSANDIRNIASSIISQATQLTNNLRREYIEQNQDNKDQLKKLEELNTSMLDIVSKLSGVHTQQETHYTGLSDSIKGLSENLLLMPDGIEKLKQWLVTNHKESDPNELEKQIDENAIEIKELLSKILNTLNAKQNIDSVQNQRHPPVYEQTSRQQNNPLPNRPEMIPIQPVALGNSEERNPPYQNVNVRTNYAPTNDPSVPYESPSLWSRMIVRMKNLLGME